MLGGDFNLASLVKIIHIMKANKKTLTLLGTSIVFALVGGGSYAFLFFAIKNKTEAASIISEKIEELSGRESRIASSVSVLRKEDANINKISEYFFKENEVVAFTKKIEALGAQSGTKLTLQSLEQGYTEKTVPFLNFRIVATGKFADIQRLLILIENFPGKFEWKTVRLTLDSSQYTEASVDGKTPVKVGASVPQWRVDAFLIARNFAN